MKRVDEKPWKPIPEGGNRISCRKSVHLHVTLGAKIKYLFASVLLYWPLCDAICTIVRLTTCAIPLCRPGRMIITKYFHYRAPFPCHRSSLQMGARSLRLQGYLTLSRHLRLCKNNAGIGLGEARYNCRSFLHSDRAITKGSINLLA